jgi:two-component system, chemotaxis family, chemotaxis protein CheY
MARILAVDDSPSMRQMVGATLQSAGHEVVTANDGDVALRVATEDSSIDLVITDVNMPNMDGISLVRELRRLPRYKGVPLLILTTEASAERKLAGKSAGATGWIVKPFNPESLLNAVSKVLG